MLCQKCGKNEATTYYEYTINGQKTQIYLCPQCAHEAGLDHFYPFGQWGVGNWQLPNLSNLFFPSGLQGISEGRPAGTGGRVCACGTTEEEVRRTGRPGCPECYNTFRDLFEPMVRRIHGSAKHTGSAPQNIEVSQQAKLQRLNAELGDAIAKQEFEKAAQLRDQIKAIQPQEGGEDK